MPKVQKVATKVVPNNKLSVQYLQRIYIQNNLQKKSCWEWQFAKFEQKWSILTISRKSGTTICKLRKKWSIKIICKKLPVRTKKIDQKDKCGIFVVYKVYVSFACLRPNPLWCSIWTSQQRPFSFYCRAAFLPWREFANPNIHQLTHGPIIWCN